MSNIPHRTAPAKALAIPLLTAVVLVASASAAFADAADRDYPDNPIMAERFFDSHRAPAEQGVAAGQGRPFFARAKPAKPMHTLGKAPPLDDIPGRP
ncbi:hypothetical protein [Labrys monachus]|uniref:Uncharacterized protein n=1 Tax=Labrys monachus TaxID=217067 RepID=A0ABU0FNR3_9HYPH|nr:hypothetical protein [Labrys monachus]MDQ0396248.1 hypothetical protein [Labrys monachus]